MNNKGTELRPAKTFTGEEYYEIQLVRDHANAVVGAWIKNPAFGDKVTETVTDEASGTTATVVTGHTGFYTMKTDADGAFAFNDDNTAGLLPYVQFDTNDNPVAAGDAAATDDTLAMASYRLPEPNLPEGHTRSRRSTTATRAPRRCGPPTPTRMPSATSTARPWWTATTRPS